MKTHPFPAMSARYAARGYLCRVVQISKVTRKEKRRAPCKCSRSRHNASSNPKGSTPSLLQICSLRCGNISDPRLMGIVESGFCNAYSNKPLVCDLCAEQVKRDHGGEAAAWSSDLTQAQTQAQAHRS
jgi:hypothetical protein